MSSRYSHKKLADAGNATRNIHFGIEPDPVTGAILPPIYQTATYAQEAVGVNKGHTYTRSSNPTVATLEKKLAGIEYAAGAVAFATGLAATTTLIMSLLQQGDHIVCSDVVFGGTVRLVDTVFNKFGISISYIDAANPENIARAIQENTKMIFLETPANPTLKLNDIAAISKIAHAKNIPVVVDNTFLTGVLQRPLELGADIILYSTTKYIDGHNATVGGALLSNNKKYLEDFDYNRKNIGNIQAPMNAWLTMQGIKTLDLRVKQHSRNAQSVAEFLEQHPQVSKVYYPGLASFAQKELAATQHRDGFHGGMLAFEVVGGYEHALHVMNSVVLCTLAESLGATETIITHPASMTHVMMAAEQRLAIGVSDGLIRFSVGLENPEDIIRDLEQALIWTK
ncbi:MAG TPA: PLP-dependent aspartate aminotransferase family protein [Burkholderiales bacterium]|nr:PLP-dependent aspartate aminotransferase family protein [Burkholderiales bacterium]